MKTVWRCFAGGLLVDSKNNLADFSSGKADNDQEVVPYSRPHCKTPEPLKPLNKCEGELDKVASHVDEPFIELVNHERQRLSRQLAVSWRLAVIIHKKYLVILN
ncbi:hypothetical protein KOY48_04795 [Candidatus Minimicrobia naudis]|uniref:Uncharacterized protein n=1 Tax=Candidatus Minimicrobia naudis TaxID=2841263 RepID=A0A8F1MBS6_9BACT|nr:hypothetical protein KOY48_04795 [Candidatus Minimicrobia naudis]